jgi:Sortilin, neurotensin receptor 3,/IPT/TIG domain
MKKLLPCLTLVGLLVLALGAAASAKPPTLASLAAAVSGTAPGAAGSAWAAPADRISPTANTVSPALWANDIDTAVTISGSGFVATPKVSLGSTALTGVTWVNGTTLTATVPWGLNPGLYPITVTNPDGAKASLPAAFTVTQGIGTWNGGQLFGGDGRQIFMKPGDPSTLYAQAYDVGLFRSTDAGEHWTFVTGNVAGNILFRTDPLHSTWLYVCAYDGLRRSTDEGDTWTTVYGNTWPDGRRPYQEDVFPSPSDPNTLFICSYSEPASSGSQPGGAQGLIKSTDGGAHWKIVLGGSGSANAAADVGVEDVAFDPVDASRMVLVSHDGRVFQSTNAGEGWSEVAKPPVTDMGLGGVITYNPFKPAGSEEVWLSSPLSNVVYKSADAALSGWQAMTLGPYNGWGVSSIKFAGVDSVYAGHHHSPDGGTTWQRYGPPTRTGEICLDPSDPQVVYLGDSTYGVVKTTDGGAQWVPKDNGLTGMKTNTVVVSRADPRRVYAMFGNWPGVYRSDDGATTWNYLPVPGSGAIRMLCEDPFNPQHLYAADWTGLYTSTDTGATWTGTPWTMPPDAGAAFVLEADPHQDGHLLVAFENGTYGNGNGRLYSSADHGATWQAVSVAPGVAWITRIVFDPQTPGLVYLATRGTGIYRSTNGGQTWQRVDDQKQPEMASTEHLVIAARPQHAVFAESASFTDYASLDGGDTWKKVNSVGGGTTGFLFLNGDSTRLYRASFFGLYSSSDLGGTWTQASGALGGLHVTALGCGVTGDQAILYAATCGGTPGAASSGTGARAVAAGSAGPSALAPRAATSQLVKAGVYRYVQVVSAKVTLKLTGLKKSALKIGRRLTAGGVVTPSRVTGKVKLVVQQRKGRKWVGVKTVMQAVGKGGVYTWKYKPARRGSYRLQVTIVKTATHPAATAKWRAFAVK